MRLYSITTALLLCLSALPPLCASLETVTADAITHRRRTPLNESDSSTTDMEARALFSRTNGEANTAPHPIFGPVQTAWKNHGRCIGYGEFGSVFVVKGGFPVPNGSGGHKVVPAVIKMVPTPKPLDRKWMALELVYLKSVGELLDHGRTKDKKTYYVVMPEMGMTWSKALTEGFPVKEKEVVREIAEELANDFEKKYGVRHLDVKVSNTVFEKLAPGKWEDWGQSTLLKKYPTLKNWKGHLVDWGYAQFRSQPELPSFQRYSDKCQVDGGDRGHVISH